MARLSADAPLLAGAASVDVTPAMGIQIDGDIGRPRPTEEVRDPLYAKALVLASGGPGGQKVCLLSMDLVAILDGPVAEIRRRAAERFGFDPASVMVHVTQNHSSPGVGHMLCRDECDLIPPEHAWLRMGDDRYTGFAIDRILLAIERANAALRPVRVGAARGLNPYVAFNRRYVLRSGITVTNPWGAHRKEILHVEGPIDPEVAVAAIRPADGPVAAMLLHHTCHPAHGYPTRYITADWPGVWSNAMKDTVGAQCVPMVVNGCCGNVLHVNWPDPNWVDDQYRMGRSLADTARQCLPQIEYRDGAALAFKSRRIRIPLREIDPALIEKSKRMLRDHPTPKWADEAQTCVDWEWCFAVSRLDLAQRKAEDPFHDYEVQAFRVGDIAILALTGEPFVEAQLEIKRRSPAAHTFVAHMSNGYVGYIPTRHALKAGGYETWTGNGSRLAPEALDMITQASVEMLEELFPEGRQEDQAKGHAGRVSI